MEKLIHHRHSTSSHCFPKRRRQRLGHHRPQRGWDWAGNRDASRQHFHSVGEWWCTKLGNSGIGNWNQITVSSSSALLISSASQPASYSARLWIIESAGGETGTRCNVMHPLCICVNWILPHRNLNLLKVWFLQLVICAQVWISSPSPFKARAKHVSLRIECWS